MRFMARAIPIYWLERSTYSAGYPGVLHVRLIKDLELKAQELVKSNGMDSQSPHGISSKEKKMTPGAMSGATSKKTGPTPPSTISSSTWGRSH
jgi:hypothetical protein